MRRILATLLALVGVTAIVLAVLSATTWRGDDELTASLPDRPSAPILVTEPGVLDMAADTVGLTLRADPDQEIWAIIAPTERVMEWVGEGSRVAVTGLSSFTELAVLQAGTEESVPHPGESDLFLDAERGTGELILDWSDTPGRWTLFAVVDGTADAPSLTLTWPRTVTTPYLLPGLVVGGVALLLALAVALWPRRAPAGAGAETVAEPSAASPEVADDRAAELAASGDYASAPAAGLPTVDPYAGVDPGGTTPTDARAADTAVGEDTESIPAVDAVDVTPEAVDAALGRDMAALAARERAGEQLRRYERRVLAEARREAYDDLRAGVDTEVRQHLRDAGAGRGAGILPYSPRADELRAREDPVEDTGTFTAIDGRPMSRRERRALERRAALASTAPGDPADGAGDTAEEIALPDGPPTGDRTSDDEWRDLWGFGPTRPQDPEVTR